MDDYRCWTSGLMIDLVSHTGTKNMGMSLCSHLTELRHGERVPNFKQIAANWHHGFTQVSTLIASELCVTAAAAAATAGHDGERAKSADQTTIANFQFLFSLTQYLCLTSLTQCPLSTLTTVRRCISLF